MVLVGQATMLHADLDAFYASVEQLLDPSLRGQPIAVGGGVVLAASYEAKAFGVRGGMPGRQARALCPALRFVGGNFREYQRLGDQVIDVLRDFTPLVERISIDEAFLDVAGATHLFGPPSAIAQTIRQRVRDEIGLPISVGVAGTKHLAKIASQVAKPDGLVVVPVGGEQEFLHPLPVELIWGVGPAAAARLASAGVRTIGDLAATPNPYLRHLLGTAVGDKLSALASNIDPRQIERDHTASSVGAQAALGLRDATPELVHTTLSYLADRVAGRLRAGGCAGRTITVRVRFAQLKSVTRSMTLSAGICSTITLADIATELAQTALLDHPDEPRISLLAVSVSQLVARDVLQLELPLGLPDDELRPGTRAGTARFDADRSVDAIRTRFGRGAIGYAAIVFSDVGHVPEQFRELAEHKARPKTSD